MPPPTVTTDQLIASVIGATPGGPLERVASAVSMAAELTVRADELVDHFVAEARTHGCSWAQIGEQLGVTRQAAQQRFVAPKSAHRRSSMFERFDDQSRAALSEAQEAARCLAHNYVGTEHLLLALLSCPGGDAARVLKGLGLTEEAVRARVEEIIGRGTTVPAGAIPFTPRAKLVLQLAVNEAKAIGDGNAGSGHILLALLREGQGVAVQALTQLGYPPSVVCERLSTVFGRPVSVDDPGRNRGRRRRRR